MKQVRELIQRMADGEDAAWQTLSKMGAEPSSRTPVVQGLIEFLRGWREDRFSRASAAGAIRILGDLQAEEAIPVLLDFLLFRAEDVADQPLVGRVYSTTPPAVSALIRIGKPAVAPLLQFLRRSDPGNAAVAALSQIVLAGILGDEQGRQLVEKEIEGTSDEKQRQRLEDCLQFFSGKTSTAQ